MTMEINPALYAQNPDRTVIFATNVLDKTRLLKSSYPNVLDVGCGTGEITNIICDKVPGIQQLIAVDKFQPMVDFAEAHNPNDRIRYKVADIVSPETLPRDWSARFNLVTAFLLLHWVKYQTVALKQICRMLIPGGEFLFSIALDAGDIEKTGERIAEIPRWRPYLKGFVPPWYFTPDVEGDRNQWRQDPVNEFSKWISDAGLEVISAEASQWTHTYPNEEECEGIVLALLPHIKQIPAKEQPEFMTDAVKLFKQSCPRSEKGKLQFTVGYIVLHGRKPI